MMEHYSKGDPSTRSTTIIDELFTTYSQLLNLKLSDVRDRVVDGLVGVVESYG
jgi:hypothetical protein